MQIKKNVPILIIRSNPVFPDPRVEKTARTLSLAGAKVTILCCDTNGKYPKQEKNTFYSLIRLTVKSDQVHGIKNIPIKLLWQFKLVFWLISNRKTFQIIHACDFDTILPALLMKLLFSTRVVYDIFDFYADTFNKIAGIVQKTVRKAELFIIKFPDVVILADKSRIHQISGSSPQKVEFIYNSPEDIRDDLIQKGRSETTKLHISYVGMLEYPRMLKELISIFKEHPEWTLALAGFGRDEQSILKDISGMKNVTWYGIVNYRDALAINLGADIMFAAFDPSIPNHKYSSPNKLFESMMLEKPIIVAENTGMDNIVKSSDCGLIIPYGDQVALEKALVTLASFPEICNRLAKNGRLTYESEYDWAIMSKRLINLYCQIIN